MHRVFLLGAGASCFAGYPLAGGLWSFVRDGCTAEASVQEARKDVMEFFAQHVPQLENDISPSLELLFTQLDLTSLGPDSSARHREWQDVRVKLMRIIADSFLWREYQTAWVSPDETINQICSKWAAMLIPGDTLITFNWDILHEASLWRRGKWHYSDGYGFRCREAQNAKGSPIKILKLHGSVNWAQEDEDDTEPSIEHKADFFRGSRDGPETYAKRRGSGWNRGRNLIVPTYLKEISNNRLLINLWNQAFDALAKANEVISIGFSLNPADALARQLIALALTRNANRPPITIVSPSGGQADDWDAFCLGLKLERKRNRKRFEDWVMTEGAIGL